MAIDNEMRRRLYRRCGGQCECVLPGCQKHRPKQRCPNYLMSDAWKAVRVRARGPENFRNLVAVCPDCAKRFDRK